MNLLGPVSDIMTANPMTLPPSATIGDAAKIFDKHQVHHIPIALGKTLLGLISMSDYLFFRRGFLDNRDDQKVEDIRMNNYEVSYIMTKGIATMNSTERINVALEIFKENLFHAIPIVNDDVLVGILTTHDIIINLAKDNAAYAEYD
ncbi:MAG: CBS domain-containing protein [Saprospiraceae bacterium]|jgi:CBS domain-containing protein|tara:strand:+ start:145 stop:585 length:441 start_codon:yes stop_codon:yes gene_type:complete